MLNGQFELSFDNFHAKKGRIYRVITEQQNADGARPTAGVPYPLPRAIHNDFPSMVSTAIYSDRDDQIIVPDETNAQSFKKFKEDRGVFFAEPSFFKIFDFPLLAGEYASLKDPNTALLTKATAEKYFSDWHLAIGKTIKRNNKQRKTKPTEWAIGQPLNFTPKTRIRKPPKKLPSKNLDGKNAPRAPGMLASHYAPRTPLRLDVKAVAPGEALLAFGPALAEGAGSATKMLNLSARGDPIEAAANLFSHLRALDTADAKAIAVMPIPDEGLGEAINDRLRRAAR